MCFRAVNLFISSLTSEFRQEADSSAVVKIENAFWKLLNESDFTKISVSRICQEAGVNRNSFYYHYESIDALAVQAFRNTVSSDLAEDFLTSIVMQNSGISYLNHNSQILQEFKHVILSAECNSPYMHKLVKELFTEVWFSRYSIDKNKLSPKEQLEIEFLFSGLISVLGNDMVKKKPFIMTEFPNTEIGKCAIQTLKRISEKQNTN